MGTIPTDTLDNVRRLLAVDRLIQERRRQYPADWYVPSSEGKPGRYSGQLYFHQSPHPIRLIAPGNGWGKTTAMGAEANAWGHHSEEWGPSPSWPCLMLWFCKLEDQFDLIRTQLESEIFGSTVQWRETDRAFRWPDGSQLILGLADRPGDWKKWQGVPVDLVLFDEQPPLSLWREMMQRRRVRRKTRYVIGATATEGDSWMEKEIYRPWLEHHQAQGLDEERALRAQTHPDIWCWCIGGIADNPGADAEDQRWYEARTWSNAKERRVRLFGGFASWVGDPVFDADAMDRMLAAAEAADAERGKGRLATLAAEKTP